MDPRGLLEFQFRYPALQVMKPVGNYRNNGLYDVHPGVALTVEHMVARLCESPKPSPSPLHLGGSAAPWT